MSLTDAQWGIAHAIAQTLVKEQLRLDAKSDGICTELKKTVTYLRASIQQPDATSRFFKYLKTLVSNGRQIGHSGRTTDYYRSIDKACSDYLKNVQDAYTILQILGWVSRLMRYYKDAGLPIGEITKPTAPVVKSLHQQEIAKASSNYNFTIGQIVKAKITAIKRNNVTYEILLNTKKLTEREPRKAASLSEGEIVNVQIGSLKDDGSIKSVKFVD